MKNQRQYDREFKLNAVKLYREGDKSLEKVAVSGSFITECLEVFTTPNILGLSLEQFYELDKKRIQGNFSKKVEFDVLKKSPKEIIYSYTHLKRNLQVTVVTRAFTTNLGL